MGKTIDFNHARVLALARPLRATSLAVATGRCLVLSLQLAEHAQASLGIDLELVRWRVVGDPQFRDHWAVWLDDQTVVDPTRVQIDGRTQLAGPASAYPNNFIGLRRYPASLLLQDLQGATHTCPSGVFPCRHLRGFARRILRHDLQRAWSQRQPRAGASALLDFLQFSLWLTLRELRSSLRQRAELLSKRLAEGPSYSTFATVPNSAIPAGRPEAAGTRQVQAPLAKTSHTTRPR